VNLELDEIFFTQTQVAYSHSATPPWCEQVPLRCWLQLYVPSLHFALAPAGTDSEAGECTVLPELLT
jgi:hypothetical protein